MSMKILVVGLGSIANRHIKNIKSIDANIQIAVYRQFSQEAALGELQPLVENVFFSQDDALRWKPSVTFITNPVTMHCQTALMFAKQDSHLFIEKPLSVNDDGLDELLQESRRRKLVVMIGYVLRFFEPIKILKKALEQGCIGRVLSVKASVGQNLLNWRPGENYQDKVSARKDLGGGVLFELSHELDYVRWLAGEVTQIRALLGKVSDLEIDVEDIAEICLRFENGALGNIHLDMIDYAANRSCRVVGTKGTVVWNFDGDNRVQLYSVDTGNWTDLCTPGKLDRNEMYKTELKHFFQCVANNQEPLVSIDEARRVVRMINAARHSAETHEVISL